MKKNKKSYIKLMVYLMLFPLTIYTVLKKFRREEYVRI